MPIRGLYNSIKSKVERELIFESSICAISSDTANQNQSDADTLTEMTDADVTELPAVENVQPELLVEKRTLHDNVDYPPHGMSWLLESGRKKRDQLQSHGGQGNPNVYSTPLHPKSNFVTPAKQMQHSSYITPQNKRTHLSAHQEIFEEDIMLKSSTILEEKENIDFPLSCSKHVKDSHSGVVTSLYSNTKSTRSVPLPLETLGAPAHDHYVNDHFNQVNNLPPPYSSKRLAFQEKFTGLQVAMNNIQMESNLSHHVQGAKETNRHQGQWQNTKPTRLFTGGEDKENIQFTPLDLSDKIDHQSYANIECDNLNNYVVLDLSDKLKGFKVVEGRKESVAGEAIRPSDVDYPVNVKVSSASERVQSGAYRGGDEVDLLVLANPVTSVGHLPYKSNQSLRTPAKPSVPVPVQSVTKLPPPAHSKITHEAHRPSGDVGRPVCEPTEIFSPVAPLSRPAKLLDDSVISHSKPEVQCEAFPVTKLSHDQSGGQSRTHIPSQPYETLLTHHSHGLTSEQVSGHPHSNGHSLVNEMKRPLQPLSRPRCDQVPKFKTNNFVAPQEVKPLFQTPKPLSERGVGQMKPDILGQTSNKFSDICAMLNSQKPTETLVVKNKSYAVMGQLGKGGSSVVYQVIDHQTSKQLAIKCVHLAGVDRESAEGYLNEIRLLDKLQDCDCVIKLIDYEFIQQTQILYVVMEKGDIDFSRLLKDIAKTKKISSLMIAYYWTEMVNAVKCIHENGIIHSDLKPANFLLVSGRLKLIDFGIASSLNVDSTSVIKENVMGTFNYISPEAIQGPSQMPETRKISFKSDIWSLGCILYNLVYGKPPFAHIVHNMSKLCAITNRNHKINYPDSSEIFIRIMQSCLRYNPKERPSAEELLQPHYIPSLQVPCSETHGLLSPGTVEKIRNTLSPDEWATLERLLKCPGNHSQNSK